MNALTKALDRSRAVSRTAHDNAMLTKAPGGGLAEALSPGPLGSMSDFQQSSKFRQRYELFRGWIYSGVNALSEEGAGQPVNLGRLKDVPKPEEKRKPSRNKQFLMQRMTKSLQNMTSHRDLEIVEDDPLRKTLEQPNPLQSRWQFVYSFFANLALTGWGYIVAGEGEDGRLELFSLPTTWVVPDHREGPFAKFRIRNPRKPAERGEELDRSQVAFAHLPNPNDPLTAMAPAGSQMKSVRIDDHIQTSQEAFFGNGIFPSVIITVGKQKFMDTEYRPVLMGAQRRQIDSAIAKMAQGVQNYGKPFIVDGLIDSVTRMQAMANEMGWDKSEDKNRTRILSALSVHPFILGEVVNVGGYAQAKIILDRFCSRVNTYLDLLSTVLTNFVGTIRQDESLLIWWNKCEAVDPSIYWTNIRDARKNGDITQDEYRTLLGFPPDEDGNQAYIKQQTLAGLVGMLNGKGMGNITSDQVAASLEAMGVPTGLSERIAGEPTEAAALGQAAEALEAAVASLRIPPAVIATRLLEDLR